MPADALADEDLADRLIAGDLRALVRAITLVENGAEAAARIHARVKQEGAAARVIGVTGAPGAGKSTLINSYVAFLRTLDRRVAVLAIDPSSPITGGAILGDRIRMIEHLTDKGVFVRSLAARGRLGGLADALAQIIDLVAAAGWSTIIVETVGAGQSETDIRTLADVRVVVTAPALGDEVQAMKSGLFEIADIFVVNKADLPGADRAARELSAMSALRPHAPPPPVVKTIAARGEGLAELHERIEETRGPTGADADAIRQERAAERIVREAERRLRDALAHDPAAQEICRRCAAGELSAEAAAAELVRLKSMI